MGAGQPPRGDFVYKENPKEPDVQTDSSSNEGNLEAKDSNPEDQITEEDLKELDEKPIPYARFKEVNEAKKYLSKSLEQTKSAYETQLKNLVNQYEAKLAAQANLRQDTVDDYDYEDESTKTIRSLQGTIKDLNSKVSNLESTQRKATVSSQLESLHKKYPNANKLAVQGWSVVMPESSLDELMRKSHEDNSTFLKTKMAEIIDRKKQKAKTAIPTGPSRIRLKDDERPKSFREATKMAKRYFPD